MKFNKFKPIISALVILATFLSTSAFIPVSEAHILVIGDSNSDLSDYYSDAKNVADMLKSKNYTVVELYRENATSENILEGMYGADAVIYEGHGGYKWGNYDDMGGNASPPFALVGSDNFIWGNGDNMTEGWNITSFTAPLKKNVPVILIGACFSTGWVGYNEVANPIETVYNFASMFTGAGANYYSTGYGSEIIPYLLNGSSFADANSKTYAPIINSTIFNGTQIWRNPDGASAFVGNWSLKFPTALETNPYNDEAAKEWYKSDRKSGYDYTPPTVTSTDPANSAVNVSKDKTIIITFNEAIKAGNLNIVLQSSNGTVIPIKTSINGNKLTITSPALLTPGTLYSLSLNTDCIRDLTGNSLQNKVLRFTTSMDNTAPTLSSSDPVNSAVNVSRDKAITVTFNEAIKAGNLNIVLQSSDGAVIPIKTSISGNKLIISHSALLANGTFYNLSLNMNCIRDLAGNSFETGELGFTTNPDNTPPTATSNLAGGLYNSTKSVILSISEPGTIYYTKNGSTPTTASTKYTGPINITSNTTLKFIAVDNAGLRSPVYTQTYTIDKTVPTASASVIGGLYKTAKIVTLTMSEPGTIYYTKNGSTPTTASTKYTGPINITSTTSLKFIAIDKAINKSPIYTQNYVISASDSTEETLNVKFEISSEPYYINQLIKFTEYSKAINGIITNYNWNFGDGNNISSITPLNASHKYVKPGTYTVEYKISDVDDNDAMYSSISTEIVVLDRNPVANYYTTGDLKPQSPIIFYSNSYDPDSGDNITSYSWKFGDGSTGTGKNIQHVYAKNGTYTVTLTVKDKFGKTSSKSVKITVQNPKPDLIITKSYKSGNYLYVTVKNQGTASSGACYTRTWYYSYYKNIYTYGLKAGSYKTYKVYFKYRHGTVKTDYYKKISELNENNNGKSF